MTISLALQSVFIPSLYILSFIYCVEGTANRKRLLDRDQRDMEGGAAISPPITATTLSRTADRPRPAKMALDFNQPTNTIERQTKTHLSWQPPLAWASTVEQDPEDLPKPTPEQSLSSGEIMEEKVEDVTMHF